MHGSYGKTDQNWRLIMPVTISGSLRYLVSSVMSMTRLLFPALLFWSAVSLHSEEKVDYNQDIRPLISNRCVACHGPDEEERKADLRLDTYDGATEDLGGYAAIVPQDLKASEFVYRIETDEEDDLMPPKGKGARFTKEEVALIKKWIEQGAEYDQHWSYKPTVRPELPEVKSKDWPRNAIDHFILARLEKEGLGVSPEADRWTLARRLSLDLTGLPPTLEEATAFVGDKSPDAYEKYVDTLLAKPSYGERWARVWLDLARYADSAGYADDPLRTIWAYRDYVIRSLNENKPFDQFTIEQIAGDLLENPTEDQLIATAFHRNTLTNSEGGTNDEEFRNVAVVDRVNTTMAVWMGTTMACAQCHTHKFDPITHAEYFQMFDYFNQSLDTDKKDEQPLLEIWSDETVAKKKALEKEVAELKKLTTTRTPELEKEQAEWEKRFAQLPEWKTLPAKKASAKTGEISLTESGGLVVKEEVEQDVHTLEFDLSATGEQSIRALKLNISEQQKENSVLSQITARWEPTDAKQSPKGRFVRIDLPGKKRTLQLAEVQVFSGGANVAVSGKATQSSEYSGSGASRAIDGKTDGDYYKKSVAHTSAEDNPWFEIDLGAEKPVDEIKVWNRTDGGKGISDRLKGYVVTLLDADRKPVSELKPEGFPEPSEALSLSSGRNLVIRAASASFEQPGFPASTAIAAKLDPAKGWGIGGKEGTHQELLLALKEPLEEKDGKLILTLRQESVHKNHLLRNYHFEVTNGARAVEWILLSETVRSALKKEASKRSTKELAAISNHYLGIAPVLAEDRKKLAALEKQVAAIKPTTTVPVMRDLAADQQRESHVQIRGNYQNKDVKVTAGTPAAFHPLKKEYPDNRLGLAKWLVDKENPLTPRVIANRQWEEIFGIGIVETSEEFGSQGELPSHPDLLDWLAVELRENGWDLKALTRLLVSSAAYRQSSKLSPEQAEADPFNRLLARGPRFRISAEMVRDQALAVSGLLSDKMYGPPAQPPQPDFGLKAAFGSAMDWKTSEGEDRHRRGIYTMWRRSNPYPSMATFDAPNREVCTVRRGRTNTPLQALVTLNDPVYVEAAQALGRSIEDGTGTIEERISEGLSRVLIRPANAKEVERLVALYQSAKTEFESAPEDAKEMAEVPIGPVPKDSNTASLAALTVVGNVILNLDELFLKR